LSELSFAIDAALYDCGWWATRSGSLAIRARFGPDPNFLFSLGGFHPEFTAPKGFPKMKPMAIGLSFDEDLKIEAQSYLALTSNTIQFGAHVVVVAKLRILTLEGGAGFDVLVNFSPFSFVADFDAFVDAWGAGAACVSVAATLSGPWFFRAPPRSACSARTELDASLNSRARRRRSSSTRWMRASWCAPRCASRTPGRKWARRPVVCSSRRRNLSPQQPPPPTPCPP
jgi:hypothetical protein